MVTLTLSLDGAATLVVVGVLGCVQIPMDLRRRVLSRQATLLAGVATIFGHCNYVSHIKGFRQRISDCWVWRCCDSRVRAVTSSFPKITGS